ncbi:cupredoxin domain-containing protein, partial [Kibdelosporangium aridum]
MIRRLIAGVAGALMVTSIAVAIPASAVPAPAPAPTPQPVQAQEQVLKWVGGNVTDRYLEQPSTAVAGVTKIIFSNTEQTSTITHTLTFDTETPGYNHDVDLNITANPGDPAGGYYEATVTLTPGKYRFYCDFPGHTAMQGELTVTEGGPDETPPTVNATVTGTKDTNGNYVGKATVAVNASDAQSGVKSVEYQIDDQSWQPYTQPFDVTAIGDHSVQYRATDNANNVSPTGSTQFRVVEPPRDSTPPTVNATVTGDKDPQGNYIGKATVAITATDTESGVKSTEYKLDTGAWTPYTAPVEVTGNGMHMVSYRATDNANNVSPEGMVHITIVAPPDATPPTVNATVAGDKDPQGNYIGKATVTVTATDSQSGVKSTEYKVDSGAWTPYTAPVEVTAAGAHTVAYRATDNANNVSPEGTVNFTVV